MGKHYGRTQNDMIRPKDGGKFVVKQKQLPEMIRVTGQRYHGKIVEYD